MCRKSIGHKKYLQKLSGVIFYLYRNRRTLLWFDYSRLSKEKFNSCRNIILRVIVGGIQMKLLFKEINRENWEECVDLRVSEIQEKFVASNWYSILQAKFEEELFPLCIYDGEVMVGFLMYGLDLDTKRMEMSRLMIDQKFQGKGYGRLAVLKLLDIIKEEYGTIKFYTSIEPENKVAQRVYESLGFKKTGEVMWGEEVMAIEL